MPFRPLDEQALSALQGRRVSSKSPLRVRDHKTDQVARKEQGKESNSFRIPVLHI